MNNYFEYEEISLTVVKRLNKKKVFALLLILILFVSLIVLLNLSIVNHKMSELAKKNNITDDEDSNINIPEVLQENNEKRLPELTQVGRNNMENIYNSNEKIAYITFDDGPSTTITPQILNILGQYNIKATFFVVGRNVERYPDLVKQEYDEGHYIANHGYSHEYNSVYSSPEALLNEYMKTQDLIRSSIGIQEYSSHLFRFPGGTGGKKYRNVKTEAKQLLSDNDILYIDWNALTNDAVGNPTNESIINDLITTVGDKNSVVILMHDAASKQLTADTLPQILDYLIGQGYTFRTFYDVIM